MGDVICDLGFILGAITMRMLCWQMFWQPAIARSPLTHEVLDYLKSILGTLGGTILRPVGCHLRAVFGSCGSISPKSLQDVPEIV